MLNNSGPPSRSTEGSARLAFTFILLSAHPTLDSWGLSSPSSQGLCPLLLPGKAGPGVGLANKLLALEQLTRLLCVPSPHLSSSQGEAGVDGQAGPPGQQGDKVEHPPSQELQDEGALKLTIPGLTGPQC